MDPSVRRRLTRADFHVSDYAGEGGRLLGRQGDGRLVPRKFDPAVLARPVC
jgi:hypothetical protein